jgi:hypothetical protein
MVVVVAVVVAVVVVGVVEVPPKPTLKPSTFLAVSSSSKLNVGTTLVTRISKTSMLAVGTELRIQPT